MNFMFRMNLAQDLRFVTYISPRNGVHHVSSKLASTKRRQPKFDETGHKTSSIPYGGGGITCHDGENQCCARKRDCERLCIISASWLSDKAPERVSIGSTMKKESDKS